MPENVILCYGGLPPDAFLHRGLGIGAVPDLRVGRATYRERIQTLPGLPERVRRLFLDAPLPETLRDIVGGAEAACAEAGMALRGTARVCVLDLRLYPADLPVFSLQLAKGFTTDLPFAVYCGADNERPVALFWTIGELGERDFTEDFTVCRLERGVFLDLLEPVDVLRLFNLNPLARAFNDIAPGANGYFVKTSPQKDKMRAEYDYLASLPAALRPFFPQCGDFVDRGDTAGYEVEIIPALDAGKLLLNGFFAEKRACAAFLDAVGRFLDAQPRRAARPEEARDRMFAVFVEKTRKRLDALLALPEAEALDGIARQQCGMSLARFGEACLRALEADIVGHVDQELRYAHGDLFLGNMLYDPARQTLKLVDPRGGSGETCWLPPWYDLAKLSHSLLGGYDLMAHGLLVPVLGDDLHLRLEPPPEIRGLDHLAGVFRHYLLRRRVDERRLRLYEGSLFLSMMPLHREAPLRMAMQLVRAIELFEAFGIGDRAGTR